MSSNSPFSSFFFASSNALSRACSSVLTRATILSMRTRSPLTLLWSYCGGTGDFSVLNRTFFLGSVPVFVLSLFCCAGDFGFGSGGASSPSLPSPWPSHNSWVTSLSQSISFVFQLISGLLSSNHGCPSMTSQVSRSIMSNLISSIRPAIIKGR